MLPTVAYVGGPAEIAYLAQSEVFYRILRGRMPVAVPRAGFTILDQRSHKLMERYGLSLRDFFGGEAALRERIATRLVPPGLSSSMRRAEEEVGGVLDRLGGEIAGFDATLAAALERSGRKIRYQLGKVERKVGREAMARDARAARNAASLSGLICPERHLQERLYSILPFLAAHGPELIPRVYEELDLECPDHRVVIA
jgi:uncharacterized protein YllA (UPF0747 family)